VNKVTTSCRYVLILIGIQACGLAFASTQALAEKTFVQVSYFGSSAAYSVPTGVAVDNSAGLSEGDVYVSNRGDGVLEKFNAAGTEILAKVAIAGTPALRGVTVDSYPAGLGEGDVYVVGEDSGVVYRFSSELVLEAEIKGLVLPTDVSVDEEGDIFVSEHSGNVVEFNQAGEPIDAAGMPDSNNAIATGLSTPQGLAVDSDGADLYVATEAGTIRYTLSGGVYAAAPEPMSESSLGVIVRQSGEVYVSMFGGEIMVFEPSGGAPIDRFGGTLGFDSGFGLAINNVAGDVYVTQTDNTVFGYKEITPPLAPTAESVSEVQGNAATLEGELESGTSGYYFAYNTGGSCEGGLTSTPNVASSGRVSAKVTGLQPRTQYTFCLVATNAGAPTSGPGVQFETKPLPAIEQLEALGVTQVAAVLSGSVNPEGIQVTGCQFEVGTGTSYGEVLPCEQTLSGGSPTPVTTKLGGLVGGSVYHYRLMLLSANGTVYSPDYEFVTAGFRLGLGSASQVGSTSAQLNASINPLGVSSTYDFEYGPTDTYGSKTPVKNLGAANRTLFISANVDNLAPGTEYHFRVVAVGENGIEAQGPDVTFRTLPLGIVGLPDGRAYEMVTPPNNENADVLHPEAYATHYKNGGESATTPFQVAPDGEAVGYVSQAAGGGSGQYDNDQLARRSAGGGWSQFNISTHGLYGSQYVGLSSNLSLGVMEVYAAHSGELSSELSPEAPDNYANLFTRNLEEPLTYSFHPLMTSVPPNREPNSSVGNGYGNFPTPIYAGSSANNDQVLFEANAALTVNAPEVPIGSNESEENDLYDSVDGHLMLVNVLPDGVPQGNANFGGVASIGPANEHHDFGHVISDDGSRIFWTDVNTHDLYVRENAASANPSTIELDAAAPGAPDEGGGGQFWTASSNGSRVFFTDEHRLTEGSTAAASEPDLYEYEFAGEPGGQGKLTDLTIDPYTGEHAHVQGVLGASEDGAYVYFVANGVLAENENAEGEKAQPQTCGELCNLYVEHVGEPPRFIAALSGGDGTAVQPYAGANELQNGSSGGHFGDWQEGLALHTAEASANGNALVFSSDRSLTGYPNNGLYEVYVYELEGSRLFCASCNPNGEPPVVQTNGAAAFLPTDDVTDETSIMRWISDDGGRVFFDSFNPLVAGDVNGEQDVYEWERDESGSCEEQNGCIYLLSGGTSPDASWLIGSDAKGDNAFFTTRGSLAPQDQNENYDLYDARVGGTQPAVERLCTGTGCQGIPSAPPPFATPSSVTFNGAGNFPPSIGSVPAPKPKPKPKSERKSLSRAKRLVRALKACRGSSAHRRRACEARARRQYGSHSEVRGSTAKGRDHA
jgi:hypothetical protein